MIFEGFEVGARPAVLEKSRGFQGGHFLCYLRGDELIGITP
jgi:hypothetical protein